MRKLEEKSSLAGRREERAAQTQGSNCRGAPAPSRVHFILTQDLQTLIANAISGILAPVDAEEQEAQD